ncbi:hypothetical protein [Antarcticirhabdus aurantiaca]|uniref:hypothetical protein n=1 Tax=Antarcticirhabdus aurantiaca TaxID=2606717 RepID=UPI00131EA764|nr:hypothetical protein [Antarcticirhabdus aurantiaca]
MAKLADQQFVIGERYMLERHEARSTKSHNHEFAWLEEAWQSLPEHLAPVYPTAEHLRKRALIEAGFYDEQAVDAGSHAAAVRLARFIGKREEFSLALVRGSIVIVRTAKSQSRRWMNKAEFQESKDGVLRVVAGILGIAPEELGRAA